MKLRTGRMIAIVVVRSPLPVNNSTIPSISMCRKSGFCPASNSFSDGGNTWRKEAENIRSRSSGAIEAKKGNAAISGFSAARMHCSSAWIAGSISGQLININHSNDA